MQPKLLAGCTAGRDLTRIVSPCPEGRATKSIESFLVAVNPLCATINIPSNSRSIAGSPTDALNPVEVIGQVKVSARANALVFR